MRAILTYHSVDPSGSPVSLDPESFRDQMRWLAASDVEVVDVASLLEAPGETDAVALTFDDGYRNFLTEAWPVLRELDLPATLFVVAGRVGEDNRWQGSGDPDVPELELLGWEELGRLAEEGVRLASHGMSHCRLPAAASDRVREELARSRTLIRERTGVDPAGFAYPYGAADTFSRQVAAANYDWACTTEHAPLEGHVAAHALPRLDTYYFRGGRSLEAFGTRRFRWRVRLRRWLRRSRAGLAREQAGGDREDRPRRVADWPNGGAAGASTRGTTAPGTTVREASGVDSPPGRGEGSPVPGTGDAPGPAEPGTPELSVVVPAHRAAEQLHESLGALLESDLPRERWELVVANDGADPETAAVARRYADRVILLDGKPRGPGYARNRGAAVARGEILVFVDADVRVHRDTLRQLRDALSGEPDVAAVFGSYDDRPPATGWVSAYRNLLHHHVHQGNAGEAETFWAGCGAIRAEVFRAVGGYDEWHFSRPQVEDIELGRRIRRRGHRILLRPDIQATHLKRWTLRGFVRTDFNHRGVPWTRLLLHEGRNESRRTLNLSWRHRACVVLAGLVPVGVLGWLALGAPWPLAAAVTGGAGVVSLNAGFFALVGRRRGWACALYAVPLHLLHYLVSGCSALAGWIAHQTVGPPLPPVDAAAFREAGMDAAETLPSPPPESVWYHHDD